MRVLVRKTLTGSEYWDTEEKKVLFVPLATGRQAASIGQATQEAADDVAEGFKRLSEVHLLGLNAEEMVAIAKEHGIEVPGTMKKVETIQKHIIGALDDASDAE